jgi:hypothetical protein
MTWTLALQLVNFILAVVILVAQHWLRKGQENSIRGWKEANEAWRLSNASWKESTGHWQGVLEMLKEMKR